MKERNTSITDLLAIAKAVVDDAERIFLDGVGSDPSRMKGASDFATDVDLGIESHLRTNLYRLTGIPVIGEEDGGNIDPEACWVVDPVDGTANFTVGNPMCSILVSLLVKGEPVVGITSMPMLGRRLAAIEGGPLHLNGRELAPFDKSGGLTAQVAFSSVASPHDSDFPSAVRQGILSELAETYLRPRITGSVGVDLALTAQGVFGGAISFSPHVWDNASGVVLIRAAGGVVTDTRGEEWHPGSDGVIAGSPRAHAKIMEIVEHVKKGR